MADNKFSLKLPDGDFDITALLKSLERALLDRYDARYIKPYMPSGLALDSSLYPPITYVVPPSKALPIPTPAVEPVQVASVFPEIPPQNFRDAAWTLTQTGELEPVVNDSALPSHGETGERLFMLRYARAIAHTTIRPVAEALKVWSAQYPTVMQPFAPEFVTHIAKGSVPATNEPIISVTTGGHRPTVFSPQEPVKDIPVQDRVRLSVLFSKSMEGYFDDVIGKTLPWAMSWLRHDLELRTTQGQVSAEADRVTSDITEKFPAVVDVSTKTIDGIFCK